MTAAALLALFGVPIAVGSTAGIVLGLLSPTRVRVSAGILRAAARGLKQLKAPERDATAAELETMRRMDSFH